MYIKYNIGFSCICYVIEDLTDSKRKEVCDTNYAVTFIAVVIIILIFIIIIINIDEFNVKHMSGHLILFLLSSFFPTLIMLFLKKDLVLFRSLYVLSNVNT